jgi:sRNA-binding protein
MEQERNLKKTDKTKLVGAWLFQAYPLCFNKTKPQPLKNDIQEDILENYPFDDVFTVDNLRDSLGWYRRRLQYLHAVIAKRPRIDLYGKVAGEVTDKDVEKALEKLRVLLQKNYGRLMN